jgi:ribosomal protein L34E
MLCKGNFQKGKAPWNKGLKGSQKSHRKGLTMEEEYGISKANELKRRISLKNKGQTHSRESIIRAGMTKRLNKTFAGENNSRYTTGISYMERKLKKEIKNCEKCGILFSLLPSKRYINIHHKDKNKKNNKRENLLLVCAKCHMKLHMIIGDRKGRYS